MQTKEKQNIQTTVEGPGSVDTTHTAETIQTAPQDSGEVRGAVKPLETTSKDTDNVDTTTVPDKTELKDSMSSRPETKPGGPTQQDSRIVDIATVPDKIGLKDSMSSKPETKPGGSTQQDPGIVDAPAGIVRHCIEG